MTFLRILIRIKPFFDVVNNLYYNCNSYIIRYAAAGIEFMVRKLYRGNYNCNDINYRWINGGIVIGILVI